MAASQAAVWIVDRVFGLGVVLEGAQIYLPGHTALDPKVLTVEDVCGGLRSLISLTFFASLFALVCRARSWWRLVMLVMAVPVAIASNIVRITGLAVVAASFGIDAAGEHSWFHNFSGVAVFAVALGFLFLLELAIVGLGKLLHRAWMDNRLLAYLDRIPRRGPQGVRLWRAAPLLVLLAAAGLSVYLARTPGQAQISDIVARIAPTRLDLPDGTVLRAVEPDLTMTAKELEILEYPAYVYRSFVAPGVPATVDVLVQFSANNRKAVHPPDVCLQGSGLNIVAMAIRDVPLPGHAPIPMRELLTENGDSKALFLYVYKCGDRYTPSFFWQQGLVFWNGLVGRFYGSDPAGALIRITVPIGAQGPAGARALAMQVAGALMPHIDRELNLAAHAGP
jgi:EpsI family protein